MMLSDSLTKISDFRTRPYDILAVDNSFVPQTKAEPIFKTAGVDAEAMLDRIKRMRP